MSDPLLERVRALVPDVQAALDALSGELANAQIELARARARVSELEALADRDPLTGLLNRRGFGRELRRAAALASRHATPAAVLYLDLDGFKAVNDTLGHDAGDAALVHVARLLEANLRATDAVGRLGGDEFGVLLLHADEKAARAKADTLSAVLELTPFAHQGRPGRVRGSFGVRILAPGLSPEKALADADSAMFATKRRRRRTNVPVAAE
jgi:diguanylate cyclase (GGDEF)-like protein